MAPIGHYAGDVLRTHQLLAIHAFLLVDPTGAATCGLSILFKEKKGTQRKWRAIALPTRFFEPAAAPALLLLVQ